jgi:hypothetical protein
MVYYIEIINFESIRNSICLADFSNGVTQQDLDIMEGVVAGDVYEMRISNMRPKNCLLFHFFSDERKTKIPRYYDNAIDPTEKPKTRPVHAPGGRACGRCT